MEEGWGPALGVKLCSAPWRAAHGRRREKEGRKKEEKEKRKRKREKKGKKKRKEERERKERERAVGAIRGGGRPRARCDARPVDDVHAEREKERRDRDWYWCRDMISGDWELGRKKILE